MPHQREHRQAAPERTRRLQGQYMEIVDPLSHTAGASHIAARAVVSSLPDAVHGGQVNIREGTRAMTRADHGLQPDEMYFFDHGEQEVAAQEDSHSSALTSAIHHSQSAGARTRTCACAPSCKCKACKCQMHSCSCVACLQRPSLASNEDVPQQRGFEVAQSDVIPQISTAHPRQKGPHDSNMTSSDRSFGDGATSRQESKAARIPRRKEVKAGITSVDPVLLKKQRPAAFNSDLAYVPAAPTKTPTRKQKDTTPLGFYGVHGSHSGQRYPTFNTGPSLAQSAMPAPPVFAAAPSTSEGVQASGPIAQTLLKLSSPQPTFQCPAVDPMMRMSLNLDLSSMAMSDGEDSDSATRTPSPLGVPRQRRHQCNKTYAAMTGEDLMSVSHMEEYASTGTASFDRVPECSSGEVTYPAIPRSTSAGLFDVGDLPSAVTQSFPLTQAGNPRDPESSGNQAGVRYRDEHVARTAGNESFPIRHSSPPRVFGFRGFGPPLPPPLPLPEFIAPKPATKQRYVSAGGNAKLGDRPVIENFTLPPSFSPGISMQKDLLLQCLDSVPRFATPTRGMRIGSPMPMRGSEEALMGYSTRTSRDDDSDQQGTKRDRKESSSSQRIARFKRVFSFGKEGKDKESKETSPG